MDVANPDPDDPWAEALGEVAELSLALARNLQQRALAAESAEDAANLAKAFHQITRGLRQTVALDARLRRERQADAAAARAEAQRREAARAEAGRHLVMLRRTTIRDEAARLIWNEYEKPEEADFLLDRLDAYLDWAVGQDRFLDGSIAEAVQTVLRELPILPDGQVDPAAFAEWLRRCADEEDDDADDSAPGGWSPATADTS